MPIPKNQTRSNCINMNTALQEPCEKPRYRSENPDPIDVMVGGRLRMRRNLVGMSQEDLGTALGLTFQQVQKYERGINRMGSSRLFQISKILSVPVSYFFEDAAKLAEMDAQEGGVAEAVPLVAGETALAEQHMDPNVLKSRETLNLVRAYYKINDAKRRRKLYELIRAMSGEV